MEQAIRNGFKKTDRKFLAKHDDAGTTAIVAFLTLDGQLIVGNAGDSRGVILLHNDTLPLSHDHKPGDRIERARIIASGHEVNEEIILVQGKRFKLDRVDGIIAVSRAIGDSEFKDSHLEPELQAVTCCPDISKFTLSGSGFFVLACDGLWDVMTNQQVIDFVRDRLGNDPQENLKDTCKTLVLHSINNLGSQDNVTAIIVYFDFNHLNTNDAQ